MRVPVLVTGRVNQPQEAEHILELGQADAVAMTRALISDPLLPAKAAAGRLDEIRACVGCNQACIGHFHAGYPISCIQYPESGRELWYGRRAAVAAADRRRVLVVGGGPAGLKAAAVAAERGHDVTLHEAGRWVGGQVLLAQKLPGRAEFGGVVTNLQGEAERAGVRIVTGLPGGCRAGGARGAGRGDRRHRGRAVPAGPGAASATRRSSTPGRSSAARTCRWAGWWWWTGGATGWGPAWR